MISPKQIDQMSSLHVQIEKSRSNSGNDCRQKLKLGVGDSENPTIHLL